MFLLKRSPPLVRAGWYDTFSRGAENPVRQPWAMWGTAPAAFINASHELEIPSTTGSNTGGPSYEHQPFTPNFGVEYTVIWPVTGVGDNFVALFIMPNWAKVGPNFTNTLGIRLFRQPVGSGDTIRIQQWTSLTSLSRDVAVGNSPVAFPSNPLAMKVWVDRDRYVRVWLGGVLVCQGSLDAAFVTGPLRRGANFMQFSTVNARLAAPMKIYDRATDFAASSRWTSQFYDDLNRGTNATVGNGWTQLGTVGQLVSNTYAMTGTTDTSSAIIRNTGITTGNQRVETIVTAPNNTADASLVARCNSAGTQGLACNFFGDRLFLSRFSSSLSGSPTFTDFTTANLTVAASDKLALCTRGSIAWVELNDVVVLYAEGVDAVVPQTNSWAGLRVERASFNMSSAFDDFRFLSI